VEVNVVMPEQSPSSCIGPRQPSPGGARTIRG
jgi:hypothetical protein